MNSTDPPPEIILSPRPPVLPFISDSVLSLILPIAAYWSLSLTFHFLDTYDLLARYRLHTPEEVLKRNHVTRYEVIRDVIFQQVIQTVMGFILSYLDETEMTGAESMEIASLYTWFLAAERWVLWGLALVGINGAGLEGKIASGAVSFGADQVMRSSLALLGLSGEGDWRQKFVELAYWYLIPTLRLGVAIFVLDTWQYFLHRLMHENKWLYRTFHSRHHRLYVPYAFGALYNHPVEGFLLDTVGAMLGYTFAGLRTRGGMVFFCLSTFKTVDDHCGYSLPWDPLQQLFWNNAGYHDVHHQSWGIKTNFSQPFLICWDRWLGTQWTGGDVSARYAASRQKAAEAAAQDELLAVPQKDDITNSTKSGDFHSATNGINGGVKPLIPNGKPARQAADSRRQAGEEVVRQEQEEELIAEKEVEVIRRRSQRINGRAS